MRLAPILVVVGCLAIGLWWLWNNDYIHQYVENGEFVTLEARYTPEQMMEKYRKETILDSHRTIQDPQLKFHPYLLMEVKYLQPDKRTKEGMILWSLIDGEMVMDADTWEKTHGFEDAINAKATRNDFKVINALAKKNGMMTYDQLQNELHLERDMLQSWLDSAAEKHLIIQKGHEIQLHMQNPKILVSPLTKINQWLVTKPYNHEQRISQKYSANQIKNIAMASFGEDFTIRNTSEFFLPIFSIDVTNPDGSTLTTHWNAINGQRMTPKFLTK